MQNELTEAQLAQEINITLPLRALLQLSATTSLTQTRSAELAAERPAIGSKGLHGIYAGIARADDQSGDYILEVIEESAESITWQDAMDWAARMGGTLPTHKQQALLFANVPELFEKEAYWSCEQYAGAAGYAWYQGFGYGTQYGDRKNGQLRARAVRRLNLK